MRFSLADLTRRTRNIRRSAIVIRDIAPPAMLATNLYRSTYAPVVAIWQRAIDPIVEEYSRTLGSMAADAGLRAETNDGTAEHRFSPTKMPVVRLTDAPSDIQSRIDAADSEFERLFIQLTAALEEWGVSTERWHRRKWADAVLSATGVSIDMLIGPEDVRETVAQYLEWNASLIRDVNAQVRQKISNSVFAGLQERKPAREVAKEIREATGFARDRSTRIASDQLSKMSASLADERRRQAGIATWKWRWSGKKHGREAHIARDGKLYADTAAGAGGQVNGQDVLAPPDDRPGFLPFCGCRSQAVISFD